MSSDYDPKRRAITVGAALAMLGFPTITLSGCGGGGGGGGNGEADDDNGPTGPNPTPTPGAGDVQGTIAANHGHVAIITAAQLQAGNGLTLDIRGNAGHTHMVALSGTEVVQIRDRQRVSKISSTTDGHEHTVTFN